MSDVIVAIGSLTGLASVIAGAIAAWRATRSPEVLRRRVVELEAETSVLLEDLSLARRWGRRLRGLLERHDVEVPPEPTYRSDTMHGGDDR